MQNLLVTFATNPQSTICLECGCVVLEKSIYAHIVLQHHRLPRQYEVPLRLYPTLSGWRRLRPHLDRIVARYLRAERLATCVVLPSVGVFKYNT